jgi:uncharacterized peroxidase-related enzyme
MITFPVHTEQTAPDESRPLFAAVEKQLGFVPNLFRVLATSPAAAQGYAQVARLFDASSLSAAERHVVLQTVNLVNACHYCVPAHGAVAAMSGLADLDRALRGEAKLPDPRLEALRVFTRVVVNERGNVPETALAAFAAAGYDARSVLDVVLGVALKTISNSVNHMARTPIDAVFAGAAA